MLTKTPYTVNLTDIDKALLNLPDIDFRHTINQPTGNFFYDPWEIKPEFKGTPWETLIHQLPNIGEARIIMLSHGKCYQAHADIDDRYHLTLQTDNSYLVDLDNDKMHKLNVDCIWYDMDTSRLHSAINFGFNPRIQLVVRKLLEPNILKNPKNITISFVGSDPDTARFKFDNIVSKWLNINNKNKTINNFTITQTSVNFDIEQEMIENLQSILTNEFKIT